MTKQALGERAVEKLNDDLVSVNFSAPTKNIWHTADSNYIATFADRLKDIVGPELRAEFRGKKAAVACMRQVGRAHAGGCSNMNMKAAR